MRVISEQGWLSILFSPRETVELMEALHGRLFELDIMKRLLYEIEEEYDGY